MIGQLRDWYTRSELFESFPPARLAFTDLHPFQVDFTASWVSMSFLRKFLIIFVAFSSVMGFILALIVLLTS
jgi:hypothetical protein